MSETITARERMALLAALRFAMAENDNSSPPLTQEECQDLEQVLANDKCLLMLLPEEKLFKVPVYIDVLAGNLELAHNMVSACLGDAMGYDNKIIKASVVVPENKEEPTV